MKTQLIYFAILVFALSNSGCLSVQLSAVGYENTASLTSIERKFTIVKHFTVDIKNWYTFFNLIPLSETSIADIFRDETASSHGDAIINVKIVGQTSLVDVAIPVAAGIIGTIISQKGGVVLGIFIGSRTYTIEGDVIKYTD